MEGTRESHPRVHDLLHPRLGKPRRGLQIMDTRMGFPSPFHRVVIDSINLTVVSIILTHMTFFFFIFVKTVYYNILENRRIHLFGRSNVNARLSIRPCVRRVLVCTFVVNKERSGSKLKALFCAVNVTEQFEYTVFLGFSCSQYNLIYNIEPYHRCHFLYIELLPGEGCDVKQDNCMERWMSIYNSELFL